MRTRLSIVVPVYNVEEFLPKCIESILAQTYSDFELIMVNDGSKDRSGEICDVYAKKDARIQVIHQRNKGVSAARNTALNRIAGEYVGFIDSDDWIEPDMYEQLIHQVEEYKADIAICDTKRVFNNGRSVPFSNCNDLLILSADEAIQLLLEGKVFAGFLVNRVYKRELFGELRFNENIFMAEDLLMNFFLFQQSKKIIYYPVCKYFYRQVDKAMNLNKYLTMLDAVDIIHDQILSYHSSIERSSFLNLVHIYVSCGLSIVASNEFRRDDFDRVQAKLKKLFSKILKEDHLSFHQKKHAIFLLMPYQMNRFIGMFRNMQNRIKNSIVR